MKKSIFVLAAAMTMLLSPASWGFSDIAVTAGAFTTEVSSDTTGTEVDSGTGFFAGIMGYMEMQDQFYMRAGALVGRRMVDFTTGTTKIEYKLTTIEAPITGMYMLNDMVGFFGGLRVGLNAGDDCSSNVATACSIDPEFETLFYGGELGAHFRFTPNFGAEVAYNIGLSDIAKNSAWDGGLVINGFMIF